MSLFCLFVLLVFSIAFCKDFSTNFGEKGLHDSFFFFPLVSCKYVFQFASGSKDHIKVQGEILEGLVARIVSHDSSKHMEKVLQNFPPPPLDGCKPFESLSDFHPETYFPLTFELQNTHKQILSSIGCHVTLLVS